MRRKLLAFALVFVTLPAFAGTAAPDFNIVIANEQGVVWQSILDPNSYTVTAPPDGGTVWGVDGFASSPDFTFDFDLNLDPDPFVTSNFTFVNLAAVTQIFTVTVTLPIAPPVGAPSQLFGSSSGTVADFDLALDGPPGAWADTGALAGDSMYAPLLDGVIYNPGRLFNAPFNQTANGPLFTNVFGPQNFNDNAGPAVNATIGIRNRFYLTGGDSIAMLNTLVVTPEPATIGLMAMALIALKRRK